MIFLYAQAWKTSAPHTKTNPPPQHEPNQPPEPAPTPPGHLPLLHPLTQAGATIATCLDPVSAHASLEELANDLAAAVAFERIEDVNDPAILLVAQARSLDAMFNRCLLQGFHKGKELNILALRLGLLAQRQCGITVDTLRRHRDKNFAERSQQP